jgi:hypothetical protein
VHVAVIACSPLFCLLQIENLQEGMRLLYWDGMHATLLDRLKLITHLIAGDICLHHTHTGFDLILPAEYKYSTVASNIWAKYLQGPFLIQLEVDWAAFNMAVRFLKGVKTVW